MMTADFWGLADELIPLPDGLRWYQEECVRAILASLETNRSTLAVLATGLGKCLGRGTPVLRYDGAIVPVEAVIDGDFLMGPDSKPRIVRGITHGFGPLYRIVPVKGDPWVCNSCHVLTLVHTETGIVTDIPLDQYLVQNDYWKHCHKLFSVGVDFHAPLTSDLPIDPYILGVWLGDGTKELKSFQVSKPDVEIFHALQAFASSWGLRVATSNGPGCPTHRVVDAKTGRGHKSLLLETMRKLFPGGTLRIPAQFLTASKASRMQLLAGLLDTDGYLGGGCFEIAQKNRDLADGVCFLARSLGFRVTRCDKVVNNTVYQRMVISGNLSLIPTRLPRKQAQPRRQKKDVSRVGFAVESLPDGEFFGFELDRDGRFLLGDFTVTHNTQIFSAVAACWDGPVLVLAHREELVEQARQRLQQVTGEFVEVEQADLVSYKARIVVGSVQSVTQERRLKRLGISRFSLVIPDEFHHYTSPTYKRVLDWFSDAKVLGVTATPDRGDEKALGQICEDIAYVMDIAEGIESGYLVPVIGQRVDVAEVDLSGVATRAGDLAVNQLDEVIVKAVEGVVHKTLELAGERKGPIFFPGVKSAELACQRLNALKPGCAEFIHAKTPDEERQDIVRRVKRGEVQFLCNVGIATEGFDWPEASMVGMARPTKSRALYAQMAGRGGRVLPGIVDGIKGKYDGEARRAAVAASPKPNCLILDFVGNSGKHALMSPEDILGGSYTEAEVKLAKLKAKKAPGEDALENLKRAREELAAMARAMTSKVKAQVTEFDPFATLGLETPEEAVRFGYKPATERQIEALRKFRLRDEELGGLSKQSAGKLLDDLVRRAQQGLASHAQCRALRKHGIVPTKVTFTNASQALDYIFGCFRNKERPDPKQVDALIHRTREPGED